MITEATMTRTLIYHDVTTVEARERTGFPGPGAAAYKLTPEDFEAHLDAIAATGVSVGPGAAAAMSFDDGGASAIAIADALERRGWRGLFFVVSGRVGGEGFLDADGVRELARRGHTVGSHSHTHPSRMAALSPAEIGDEWARSRAALGDLLGSAPAAAAVPGGSLSEAVYAGAARAGYELLFTSAPLARTRTVGGMTVAGRYAIWAGTPPRVAAAYARGAVWPRLRLRAGYDVKRAARRLGPRTYERLRLRARGG
jgi:peptidoglycan/xylan/chitin deacetylase (PgdA/CDA1 family)